LPPDFKQLEGSEKIVAQNLYMQQSLCTMYRIIVNRKSPKIYKCLEFQESPAFTLLLLARNLLIDGEAQYIAQACELEEIWESLPGAQDAAFPLCLSPTESQTIQEDVERSALGMAAMRSMRESLGDLFPEQGYVSPARHQEAVDALKQTRDQILSDLAESDNGVGS
jgi:hypothetical protein